MQSESLISWTITCYDSSCMSPVNMGSSRARGDVVDELVDASAWRYAVVIVRSEPDRERLAIAYPDEETLRHLIAAPSIVALGYTSRADALMNMDRCVTTKPSLKRLLKMASLHPNMTFLTECRAAWRRLRSGFGFSGTSKIMRNLLHNGLAAALIFFYSRNVLSSTVRAFISF
jgi:hypothetical protein